MTSSHKRRKYNIKKKRIYIPTELEKERMCLVKRLYDEYGTLEKVGSLLRLTRERVRQILEKGNKYHFFTYELTRDKEFREVVLRISKDQLTHQIKNTQNKFDICTNLEIDINDFFKLIGHYNIDINGYRQDARFKRYITDYSQIVNILGRHPSTTELQRRKEWRKVWAGIDRLWGGIDRFRTEFGIEKPKVSLHPNTINGFNQARKNRVAIKEIKVDSLYKLIQENGPLSCRKLSEILKYSYQNTYCYLRGMIEKDKIEQIGKGSFMQYRVKLQEN